MMAQDLATSEAGVERPVAACRHYWIIQPATGPVSQGACQTCGEVREFKNYVGALSWSDEKPNPRSRGKSSAVVARGVDSYDEAPEEE